MSLCLVGLGSNLGDRALLLHGAIEQLRAAPDVRVLAHSRLHESTPAGGPSGQGRFLNSAALLETNLDPYALLANLQRIEHTAGRVRTQHWGPRTLDLDLLLFDDVILETPDLVVPHPRFAVRRFALGPAAEIAPEMMHPTIGWSVGQLNEHLETSVPYVAIAGPIGGGQSQLASELAIRFDARLITDPVGDAAWTDCRVNSSGSIRHRELEFLDLWTSLLDRSLWGSTDRLAVSDFHFSQLLASAKLCMPRERFAEFQERWRAAEVRIQPPRFSVDLNADAERLTIAGPVVRLRGADWDAERDEVFAAIVSSGSG